MRGLIWEYKPLHPQNCKVAIDFSVPQLASFGFVTFERVSLGQALAKFIVGAAGRFHQHTLYEDERYVFVCG
jgi:hypothetical protein